MKKSLFLLLAVCSFFVSNAQRTCGTMDHQHAIEVADPKIIQSRQIIEQQYQSYISNPFNLNKRLVVTIPVVVHVVYNTTAQNISDAQIQSQIDVINKDFRKLNADTSLIPAAFKSVAADCEIQFCLAQRDPNGNATTGITRTSTTSTSFIDDDKVKYTAQGGKDIWNRNSYLNLWVCNLGGGLLGYAQFPGGTAASDGVVINYKYFGTIGTATAPYAKGRTATHEIGHWLNLYHTFQGGCAGLTNSNCSTGGDKVCDTPPVSTANYGCPGTVNSCTETSPFPSPYTSNQNDMTMNYMDYVDDACMYMFTAGQKVRIQSLFGTGGSRASLLSSQGCVAVNGAPTPDFTASATTVCAGQTVTFTNNTTGGATSYAWTFTGGTPSTSTATTPTVTYSTAGTYTVSLTATNANGSNTATKTAYITVLGSTALPLVEGFESTTFPPTGWSIGNSDNSSVTWARATNASGFGTSTACAYVDNYNLNAVGTKEYLYTPSYNFIGITNGYFKFDYAYAPYSGNTTSMDTLQIMYSTNCGVTWTSLWKKGGNDLKTANAQSAIFVPTASQWKKDSVILTALSGQASVRFAIVNINKYGNSILVDNINIYNKAVAAAPVADFVGVPTTVTVGNTVTFTDLSTNAPTSWSWSFTGGTPATSTTQNPVVTYNTVGVYPVSLTATNATGNNTATKTAYITVVAAAAGGCDTLANLVANDSARIYTVAASSYVSGHNTYGDLAKAEKYTTTAGNQVTGVMMAFGVAKYASTASKITAKVWNNNGTNGTPGTVLASKDITIASIAANIAATPYQYTTATFTTPAAIGTTFYVGFEMTYASGDTVAVYTTQTSNAASHPYQAWEKWSDGTWAAYDTSWNVALSNYIFPIVCAQSSPVAAFTANSTSVCAGKTVTFTDQSTNSPTSWAWSFPGGTPTSSTAQNPVVTYNIAGTYNVTLTATNGAGNNQLVKSNYIVVKANPTGTTTSTAVACYGGSTGSATVAVTGGTSPYTYSWSGGGTTATISNKPAGTYTVSITDNAGCSSTATVNISQPFAAVSAQTSTVGATCGGANGSATVVASGGSGSYTYTWSNSLTTATISNLAAGTYSCTVKDGNNCSVVTTATVAAQANTLSIIPSSTDASCGLANGTATATPNTSTVTVTYAWSNGNTTNTISNMAAGTYTCTITSSTGCTASASITINSGSSALSVSATPVSTTCGLANGSVSVSGAPTNATYSWSNGMSSSSISGLAPATYTVTVNSSGCTGTASATVNSSTVHQVSVTSIPANCGSTNGSATATVTPAGTYNYSWSNGQTTASLSNVAAGSYTVTVSAASGCTATASAAVNNVNGPTASVTKTNISCFGVNTGSASVSVSGGTSPYNYAWSNGGTTSSISNLPAGNYSCTITDAAGCKNIQNVAITTPTAISASGNGTTVSCFGNANGSATVSVSGGTGAYSYSWSNSATTATLNNLTAGTYTVTVTDANLCTATASAVVSTPAQLAVNLSQTNVNCAGSQTGTANAVATGGSGSLIYIWSNGSNTANISGLAAGAYSVTVRDANNCSATASTSITQPAAAVSAVSSSTQSSSATVNDGTATATATGGTSPYTYAWSNGGTTASISNLAAGTYSCTVTDSKGCTAVTSVNVTLKNIGIDNIQAITLLSVQPIPADNYLDVSIKLAERKTVKLEVISLVGQKLFELNLGEIKEIDYRLDIQHLAVGAYYLRVNSDNEFKVKSFVKQ